jgi:hypothetical protein
MDRADHTEPVYLLSKLQIEYVYIFCPQGSLPCVNDRGHTAIAISTG